MDHASHHRPRDTETEDMPPQSTEDAAPANTIEVCDLGETARGRWYLTRYKPDIYGL